MQTTFQAAYTQLNAAQKLAVDTIEGPVLVVAGPGTGKTQLLSLRIANILDKTDTLPQNILCLTFTESGAQTMRERLLSIIGKAAYDVTISTYHAFGSELLRRYPEYFSAEADLKPADDLAIDGAFRNVQARLPYSNPLKSDIFLSDIAHFVSDSKRALLTPKDLRLIAADNLTFIKHVSETTKSLSEELRRVSKGSVQAFKKLLDVAVPVTSNLPEPVQPLVALWHNDLETALTVVNETGKTTALSKWKLRWLAKDDHDQFVVAGAEQQRRIQAAADIYEAYIKELERQGLYDYDDMILRAIRGLEANDELRFSLQERYQYLLLDEFQDTNQAQYHLVELLSENPVNEGRPNILAVGDDDQAIYAFQGANYSHMLQFYEQHREVSIIPLVENYRSQADILRLAQTISDQIETRLHHHFPAVDKNLVARTKQASKLPAIRQITCISEPGQAAWIAGEIKRLIASGLPTKEIALIAPKHAQLESVLPYLRQAEIPIRYERREDILDDPAIEQLVTMGQLIAELGSDTPEQASPFWPAVLTMPFWKLSPELIWHISWQAREKKRDWTELLLEDPKTHDLALFFIKLSQQYVTQPFEQLLDQLIGVTSIDLGEPELSNYHSPYYGYYFGELDTSTSNESADYWQLLSNLTVLRERLREYHMSEVTSLTLIDFLNFVIAHQSAHIKILNTNPYRETETAVELLTAHRAKGREFEVVFVVSTIDEAWGGAARSGSSRLGLPPNLQFIRYAGADEDERLRLLYVALTRAKRQLYLTSYRASYSGRKATELKYLASVENSADADSKVLPQAEEPEVTIPTIAELSSNWRAEQLQVATQPKLRALLQSRLEHYQLSPTEYNRFLDVIHGGPADFFVEIMLRFPKASSVSLQFGNAMHQTLEWIHYYNKSHQALPTTRQVEAAFKQRLESQRPAADVFKLLIQRGNEALQAYLKQRASTIQVTAYCEYNFRDENVFIGEAHLTGKIDKLLIDEANKTIVIVDYKTGSHAGRWERTPRMHAYQYQLYFYKLLVEHSRRFKGYKVIDAYLEFVEPDQEGIIQELHLPFEAAKTERLKLLIEIVWQHIMDLDFPSISNYPLTLNGIEQFEAALLELK